MGFKEYIEIVLMVITPFAVVAWAIVQFFTRRIVSSLDENSAQLKAHSEMMTSLAQSLKELSVQFLHINQLTGNELKLLNERVTNIDSEVHSLRKDRHDHGTVLTQLVFRMSSEEKRTDRFEAFTEESKSESAFVGERMHDIINAISSLWGIAKIVHNWPIPETPDIRSRKSKN